MKYAFMWILIALAGLLGPAGAAWAQAPARSVTPSPTSTPASVPAPSASRVYRCGNQYTNAPTDAQAKDCKLLEGANVTVVEGTRLPPGAGRSAPQPGLMPPSSLRVDSSEQRTRDADARTILEAELRKAQARQAELQKEYNNGEPEKLGPETRNYQKYLDRVAQLKASIARTEVDIEGLRRELSRLTASK